MATAASASASAVPSSSNSIAIPSANEQLLAAASAGDLATIKALLTTTTTTDNASPSASAPTAQPWYESPTCLGWSALHFAAERGHTHVIRYLLRNGAIWNAVDLHGFTAGEIAWSGNWRQAYQALLDEGVRQTLLLNALAEQRATSSDNDDDDDEDEDDEKDNVNGSVTQSKSSVETDTIMTLLAPSKDEVATSNQAFLSSPLRFFTDEKGKERCLDQDDNMVMAGWETDIMKRSAEALCKDLPKRFLVQDEDGEERFEGFKVLNIGYGLGIIDDFFQEFQPVRHVIVEPHPDAIAYFHSKSISKAQGVELIPKRWEDALLDPELGEFDVVYADPFSQDYGDLKKLFDLLPNILNGPQARFSFFHGLAGTNRFFYDVYTRLAELDLRDVGMETEWQTVPVKMEDKEEVWRGVKREYWKLDQYRLPICQMSLF